MLKANYQNRIIIIIFIILFIISSYVRSLTHGSWHDNIYLDTMGFYLSYLLQISILIYWLITINNRIMKSNVRYYLFSMGGLMIFWFLVRNIKWLTGEYAETVSRFLWYLFYIPILLLPIFCLFTALCLNKDENYWPPPKAYFLFLPSLLLILMVLTNDLHQFVFAFNPNFANWNREYSYNSGYFLAMAWLMLLIISTLIIIIKNWRLPSSKYKIIYPISVLLIGLIYGVIYANSSVIVDRFIDMTTLFIYVNMLFWEAIIQIGLLNSNKYHRRFFMASNLKAQIVSRKGQVIYSGLPNMVNPFDYSVLHNYTSIKTDADTLLNLSQIKGGYISWQQDISQLNSLNCRLNNLNSQLNANISFLEEENKLKSKSERLKQQNHIYDLIGEEILPHMEKISLRVKMAEAAQANTAKQLLKEINVISCYIKRKTNLLLDIDRAKTILSEDIILCYRESFRGLEALGIKCAINYQPPQKFNAYQHMLYYDIFQEFIEKADFKLSLLIINYVENLQFMRFSIIVPATSAFDHNFLDDFKNDSLSDIAAKISIAKDEEAIYIRIDSPNLRGCSDAL